MLYKKRCHSVCFLLLRFSLLNVQDASKAIIEIVKYDKYVLQALRLNMCVIN